jgi:phage-related protein (TIGR01555 family)
MARGGARPGAGRKPSAATLARRAAEAQRTTDGAPLDLDAVSRNAHTLQEQYRNAEAERIANRVLPELTLSGGKFPTEMAASKIAAISRAIAMGAEAVKAADLGDGGFEHYATAADKDAPQKTRDAFVAYQNRIGVGAANILSTAQSSFQPISRVRIALEWAFIGQALVNIAVNLPADDMFRQGYDITGSNTPTEIEAIHRECVRLGINSSLADAVRWSRLYGTAFAMIDIDGQRPDTPLRVETVWRGQMLPLKVFDMWLTDPNITEIEVDRASTNYGLPMYYRILGDAAQYASPLRGARFHNSRAVRFDADKLPYLQAQQRNLYSNSIVEKMQDVLAGYNLSINGAAQLIHRAVVRWVAMKDWRSVQSAGGAALAGAEAGVNALVRRLGIEGMGIIDAEDRIETNVHGAWSGLSDVCNMMMSALSAATQVPRSKLFGEVQAGLGNGDGLGDQRNYYDFLRSKQAACTPQVTKVMQLVARNIGIKPAPDFGIEWRPLERLTPTEKATVAKDNTATILSALAENLISPQIAMMELRQTCARDTGMWTNLTEDVIKSAAPEPVPAPEESAPTGEMTSKGGIGSEQLTTPETQESSPQ